MFDIEKFIDLIHDRPLLWDKKIKEHADITNRDLAWIEIGEEMYNDWLQQPSVEREEKVKMMKSKWRHLRDNYLRSLKVDKSSKRKKYVYAERMEFLLDTFGNRITLYNKPVGGNKTDTKSTCSNVLIDLASKIENDNKSTYTNGHIDSESNIRNDNYEANDSCSSDTIEDTYQLKKAQPSLSPTKKCQNTKLPTLRPKLPSLRPKLQTLEPKLSTANHMEASPKQEEDADLMFFNSLLPDYKELDEEEKLDFRIKCLQFIRDARKSRKS